MAIVKIKGHEFNALTIRDSANRRAQKFKNNILENLRLLGLTEDDILIELEPIAIKNVPASASWYLDGYHCHYSYKAGAKYVENLYIVSKLVEFEVAEVMNGTKDINQFIRDFSEEHEVEEERKSAREYLGVSPDELDLNLITKKYKDLAKEAHPDMENGSTEKFKALNRAHKILKRELE